MSALPYFIIPLMIVVSLYNPYWGLYSALCWSILADKVGAHMHIELLHIPIYVTEAAMAGILLSMLVQHFQHKRMITDLERHRVSHDFWIAFYANALVSALRGFFAYG